MAVSADGPAPVRYDAIVVGAGLAGMLAVLSAQHLFALHAPEARLLWLDAGDRGRVLPVSDGRGITITPGTMAWCETVGVTGLRDRAGPMDRIAVHTGNFSDKPSLIFDAKDYDVQALGYVTRADVLLQSLGSAVERSLQHQPSINFYDKTEVVAIDHQPVGCEVRVAEGRVFHGEVLLIADGKHSPTRRLMGVDAAKVDYGQSAMIAVVSHEKSHGHVAHESFQPNGPLAILPLPCDHRSSLVWTETSAAADYLLGCEKEEKEILLTHRFGAVLGACRLEQPMASHPLAAVMPHRIVDGSVLWLGDAAHTIHPIAGQGWNVGVQDVRAWYDLTASIMAYGGALGSVAPMYQQARQSSQWTMFALTDGLERWFRGHRPFRPLLSHAAMLALGSPLGSGLRKKIVRYAMQ